MSTSLTLHRRERNRWGLSGLLAIVGLSFVAAGLIPAFATVDEPTCTATVDDYAGTVVFRWDGLPDGVEVFAFYVDGAGQYIQFHTGDPNAPLGVGPSGTSGFLSPVPADWTRLSLWTDQSVGGVGDTLCATERIPNGSTTTVPSTSTPPTTSPSTTYPSTTTTPSTTIPSTTTPSTTTPSTTTPSTTTPSTTTPSTTTPSTTTPSTTTPSTTTPSTTTPETTIPSTTTPETTVPSTTTPETSTTVGGGDTTITPEVLRQTQRQPTVLASTGVNAWFLALAGVVLVAAGAIALSAANLRSRRLGHR